MINTQKGFAPVLLLLIALVVIGGGVYVYKSKSAPVPAVEESDTEAQGQVKNEEQADSGAEVTKETTASTTQPIVMAPVAPSNDKYKGEIQDLLNSQCKALTNKDATALLDTIDQSNASKYQDYKKSVGILISMTSSVESCKYEVKSVEFKTVSGSLTAATSEKGDLRIKLIDGSIKTIENPNTLIKAKYILSGNKWKQVISK